MGNPLRQQSEMVGSREARKMLGNCCRTTLARYLRAGHIGATKFNSKRFLYHRNSIEAYLERLRTAK
jgi:predicted site-specific integrase-resolvase